MGLRDGEEKGGECVIIRIERTWIMNVDRIAVLGAAFAVCHAIGSKIFNGMQNTVYHFRLLLNAIVYVFIRMYTLEDVLYT